MTQADTCSSEAAAEQATSPKRKRRKAREPLVPTTASNATAPRETKASVVEEMLNRNGGASLDELCQATDWQPHTCRAFLTGLRKKRHAIERAKGADGVTRWSISVVEAI